MKNSLQSLLGLALASLAVSAQAAIVTLGESQFAGGRLIDFQDQVIGAPNPTYTGLAFGSYFVGQRPGTASDPACAGIDAVQRSACIVPRDGVPLEMAFASRNTFVAADPQRGAGAQVLSGTPSFNGSLAILFDVGAEVRGFGFDWGFLNALGTTQVTAYARDGTELGSLTNTSTGIPFLGIGVGVGDPAIAGLLVSLVASDTAGFAIDNLRFLPAAPLPPNGVPEPASLALVSLALLGAGIASRRRRTG